MGFSNTDIQKVWEKAKTIRGKDPAKYRQDPYGTTILRSSYGKETSMGWEIDHIKPSSLGGSDSLVNLQALHWKKNREKGNSMQKRSRHNQR